MLKNNERRFWLFCSPAYCVKINLTKHYSIGVTFALAFVAMVGSNWLQHPTLIPAVVFGMITVFAPFFLMHPSFGLGLAASKTANPTQARFRSLVNHTAFGMGLYLFGLLVSRLL
ncbi:MAG: DUF2938 family protein [Ardenticatenaceae bacterium]|nr:DUF2938 family protein [Ardenticatenaceae bacterium]